MDWLDRWARDRPDAPYLIVGDEVVTFRDAAERVASIAGGVAARYRPGSRLGVLATPSPGHLLTMLAVSQAGMILVPLPDRADRAERSRLAVSAGLDDIVDGSTPPTGQATRSVVDETATRAAFFTSGTTGEPRLVRLTGRNLDASAAASARHLAHGPEDRWLAVLPFHHVGGYSVLTRSARQGSAVVVAAPFEAVDAVRLLEQGVVTLASFVSAMVEAMLDAGLTGAPGLRHALVGGGPMSTRAGRAPMPVLATYGMTETASQVATADPGDPRPDRLVVLDGARITLAEDGRILVAGPMVSPGDLDDDTVRTTVVTDDLGRFHDDRLEVLGRADRMIVTGGENVSPERVERLLSAIPGVGSVAAVGLPDARWGALVAAAYTGDATPAELDAAARAVLARHEVPRRWVRVEAIPTLGIGKIDHRSVADLFA